MSCLVGPLNRSMILLRFDYSSHALGETILEGVTFKHDSKIKVFDNGTICFYLLSFVLPIFLS